MLFFMTINIFQTGSGHGMSFLIIVKSILRLIRSGSLRRREGSREEIGVWSSQGGGKDKGFFPLSPELMIAQQNN